MNSRLLTINRIKKTPLYCISHFTIGNVSGYLMEPPAEKKVAGFERTCLNPGFYSLAWADFNNPSYRINFKEKIPVLFNNKVHPAESNFIGHGNKPLDASQNNMIAGVWYKESRIIGSVKTLKKLTDYLTKVGIEHVSVVISDLC